MKARRVVITGLGAVTPIGTGAEGLWHGLEARTSAVREISRFDPTPFRSHIAAEIPDFRPQDHLDSKRAKRLDRFSQLAVTCARLALADAGVDPARENLDDVGAMMGSALGGVAFAESQVPAFLKDGPRGLDAALALAVFGGAASCNIAIEFGFTGPNATNGMSCASGTIAVGDAFHAIRAGRAQVTTTRRARRGRSTRIATASSWAKARRCWYWKSATARWRAAPRCTARSWAMPRPMTPTT